MSGTTAAAPAAHRRYLSSPHAATLHGKIQGFVLRLPPQNMAPATFIQPFQCDLQPQLQETQRTTPTGTTTRCKTHRRNQSRPEQPQPHPPHTRGTFHRRHAATLHGKIQGFVLRLPPQNKAHATFMQPFQCDLQPQIPKHPIIITTHTQAQRKQLEATVTMRQKMQAERSRTRRTQEASPPAATLHGKKQGFVLRLPPQHKAHAPFQCNLQPHHFPPSSPLPFVTTSLRHHFPSSPLPFVTTSLRHHFPSSPLPFVTTSLRHHFPLSPLPFVTTSLHSLLFFCDVL